MFARAPFSCLFLLALSACATDPSGIEKNPVENAATIQGYFERDDIMTWLEVRIASIDIEPTDYGIFDGPDQKIPISPGKRRVIVEVQANNGLGGECPCKGYMQFKLAIEPNAAYRAKARWEGDFAELWIEDTATEAPVTERLSLRPR